jgi:hypothetical protein
MADPLFQGDPGGCQVPDLLERVLSGRRNYALCHLCFAAAESGSGSWLGEHEYFVGVSLRAGVYERLLMGGSAAIRLRIGEWPRLPFQKLASLTSDVSVRF